MSFFTYLKSGIIFNIMLEAFFKSIHHKNHHIRHKEAIKEKSWHFFRWEVWVILIAMFIVALLNVVPNWFVDTRDVHGSIAEKYWLRNDIVFSSISVFLTIGVAIFIGVFTEMGKYVGKFGSAIFILVPALLWLFSERGEEAEGLEKVVEAAKNAADIVFWVTVAIILFFALASVVYYFVIINILDPIRKERFEYWNNFSYRLMLLLVNILIILMMAYALINYALFSLHLGDLTPQERQAIATNEHKPLDEIYPIVFHNDRIVVYHSVVTAFFSVLMVLIGMTNFVKEAKQEIRISKLNHLEQTVEPDKKQLAKIKRLQAQIDRKRPVAYEKYEPDVVEVIKEDKNV